MFGQVTLGYLTAVFIATLIMEAMIFGPAMVFSSIAPDPFQTFLIGFVWTFICALPGFVAAIILGERRKWDRWFHYALAGLANAAPALLIFTLLGGSPLGMPSLIVSTIPAGYAAGAIYWFATGQHVARQRAA